MRPSSGLIAVLLIAAAATSGCTPRCQESCTKVLDCGLGSTRVARDECITACRTEEDLYARWEDDAKIDAFKEHKRCIRSSTCEEIAAGVCHDEDLAIFE